MPNINRNLVTKNLSSNFDSKMNYNSSSSSGISSDNNLEDDTSISGRRVQNHRTNPMLGNPNLNKVKKGYKKARGHLNISVSSSTSGADSDAGRQTRGVGKIKSQQRTILSSIPSSITVSKQTLPLVGGGSKYPQPRSNIIQKVPQNVPMMPIARSSPKVQPVQQMAARIVGRPHTPIQQHTPNSMLRNLQLTTPTSVERRPAVTPVPVPDAEMISPAPQDENGGFQFPPHAAAAAAAAVVDDQETNDEDETNDENETDTETNEEDEQQPPQQNQQHFQVQQQYPAVEGVVQFFNNREPIPLVKLEPVDHVQELQQMLPSQPQLPPNASNQQRFIWKQEKKVYEYKKRCHMFKEREIGSKMIFRSQLWNSGLAYIIFNNRYSSGEINDLMMNLQVVSEILYYELRLDYFQDTFDQQQLQIVRAMYPHCLDCKGVMIEPEQEPSQSVPHAVICPLVSQAIRKMITCFGYRCYEKELKKLSAMHKKAIRAQLLLQ